MKRSAVLFSLMLFSFSKSSFAASWKHNQLKREILALHAIMDVTEYASTVGAVWYRIDRTPEDPDTLFDIEVNAATTRASGQNATREAHRKAAELVSDQIVWMFFSYNGADMAHTIAYQHDWTNFYQSAISAGKQALKEGGDANSIGVATARAARKYMDTMEAPIRDKINNGISFLFLVSDVDFQEVLRLLKSPLETEEFTKHTLPEIQEYYKAQVALIEEKIKSSWFINTLENKNLTASDL